MNSFFWGGFIIGFAVLVSSCFFILPENRWRFLVPAIFACVTSGMCLSAKKTSFQIKAFMACLLFSGTGAFVLLVTGLWGPGFIWLFAAPVIAVVLSGFQLSVVMVAMNVCILLAVGIFSVQGSPAWTADIGNPVRVWAINSSVFLVVNIFVTAATAVLLDRVTTLMAREQKNKKHFYRKAQTLKKERDEFETVLKANANPVAVYDTAGKPRYLNPAFRKVFGWSIEALADQPDRMTDGKHREKFIRRLEAADMSGKKVSFETKLVTVSGKVIDTIVTSQSITNGEGRISGFVVNFTDITDRKRLEVQLQQARKMEAMGTLATGIAHDFNNVLQIISSYADIMFVGREADHPDYFKLKSIHEAAERAGTLVRQLLVFSRKADARKRLVDINRELKNAIDVLERVIPKMIEIEAHLQADLWKVHADPVQIEQILLNLGSNAVDAMPDGGKIIVKTENIHLDDADITKHGDLKPGSYVLFCVSDTGHGIEESVKESIFDPFFSTKEPGKGTGLGLASVFGIVKNSGGVIECDSQPGRGAVFKIYLPAADPARSQFEEEITASFPRGGDETVLVVDDEVAVRDFASNAFSRFGYKVITTSDGERAVQLFKEQHKEIHLIILDIGMPGIGGHRCFTELQKIDPEVKVIIASGYAADGEVKKTIESGASGFLAKPYRLVDLLKTARMVLDQ